MPDGLSWQTYQALTAGVGLAALALVLLAGLAWLDRWAARERRRSAAHLGQDPETDLPQVRGGGFARLRHALTDPATIWRGCWSVASAAVSLAGPLWLPLAADALRGILVWPYRMYSLHVLVRLVQRGADARAAVAARGDAATGPAARPDVVRAAHPDGHGGRAGPAQPAMRLGVAEPAMDADPATVGTLVRGWRRRWSARVT